jgi:ribonuclease P protein component
LCSKKQIDGLFTKGTSITSFPIKVIFYETAVEFVNPCQVMFVVPKRIFKRAHDRNKTKRRLREAYRLNKTHFYEMLKNNNKKVIFSFIYISKKIASYEEIEKSTLTALKKMASQLLEM